jgi:hypothetical protein
MSDPGYELPVSELAQAKYYPRIFAESIWAELNTNIKPAFYRIQRTYTWELYDTSFPPNYNANGAWGLFHTNQINSNTFTHTAKLAYYAEKNLIALLSEPSAHFTPAQLNYSITHTGNIEIRHILLQKSNHDYYLLLWQEAPVYNSQNHSDISNPAETATITLPAGNSTCTQYSYTLSNFTFSSTTLTHSSGPNSFQVSVPDTITVLKITGLN